MLLFGKRRKRKRTERASAPGPAAQAQAAGEPTAERPPTEKPRKSRTADDVLRELEAEERRRRPAGPVDPTVGRCLLAEGPITAEFLRQQLAVSGQGDSYLGRLLATVQAPSEEEVFAVLAAGYRIPVVDLKQCRVPVHIARSIPRETALKYKAVPIARFGDLLCVAFGGRPNPKGIEAIRRQSGLRVKAFSCPPHHMAILLRRAFPATASARPLPAEPLSERDYELAVGGPEARWENIHASAGPVPATRLADRRASPG